MWTDDLMQKLAGDYFKTDAEEQQKITDSGGPAPAVADEHPGEAEEAETEELERREEKPQVKASSELRQMLGLDKEAGILSGLSRATKREAIRAGLFAAPAIAAGFAGRHMLNRDTEKQEARNLESSSPTESERFDFRLAMPETAKVPAAPAAPSLLARLGLDNNIAKTLMFGAGIPLALYGGSRLLSAGPDTNEEEDEDEE